MSAVSNRYESMSIEELLIELRQTVSARTIDDVTEEIKRRIDNRPPPSITRTTPTAIMTNKIRGLYFAGQAIFRHPTIKTLLDRIDELESSPSPLMQPVLKIIGFYDYHGRSPLDGPIVVRVNGGEDIRLDEGDLIKIEVEKGVNNAPPYA